MQLCKHKPSDCTCYSKQKCHLYSSKKLKNQKENREGKIHLSLSLSHEDVECVRNTMKEISNDVGIELLGNKNQVKFRKSKKKIIDIALQKGFV